LERVQLRQGRNFWELLQAENAHNAEGQAQQEQQDGHSQRRTPRSRRHDYQTPGTQTQDEAGGLGQRFPRIGRDDYSDDDGYGPQTKNEIKWRRRQGQNVDRKEPDCSQQHQAQGGDDGRIAGDKREWSDQQKDDPFQPHIPV